MRHKRSGLVTWAAAQGAPNAVELLVSAGFDVNALGRSDIPSNEPWHTALHVAAETGNLALAQTLLALGADPDIPDKHYRSTPLGGPGTSASLRWSNCLSRLHRHLAPSSPFESDVPAYAPADEASRDHEGTFVPYPHCLAGSSSRRFCPVPLESCALRVNRTGGEKRGFW